MVSLGNKRNFKEFHLTNRSMKQHVADWSLSKFEFMGNISKVNTNPFFNFKQIM